jgi:hypothetical protein
MREFKYIIVGYSDRQSYEDYERNIDDAYLLNVEAEDAKEAIKIAQAYARLHHGDKQCVFEFHVETVNKDALYDAMLNKFS